VRTVQSSGDIEKLSDSEDCTDSVEVFHARAAELNLLVRDLVSRRIEDLYE